MRSILPILVFGAVLAACGSDSRSRAAVARVEVVRVTPSEQHFNLLQLVYDAAGAWIHFDVLRDNQPFESGRIEYAGARIAQVETTRIDGVTSTSRYTFDGDRLTRVDLEHRDYSLVKDFEYDDRGRLTRSAGSGALEYFYNGAGRLEKVASFAVRAHRSPMMSRS